MELGGPKNYEEWRGKSFYKRWQDKEGIPIYTGYFVDDVYGLPLGDWKRKGGSGAYLNLGGQEESDLQITEIPPGASLKPERHLFEEIILVLQGTGATTIRQEGSPARTFEWQPRSLFAMPLNAWHQHFNGSATEPVRLLSYTNLPITLNLYHNDEFVFNNSFDFSDRFKGEDDYFHKPGKKWGSHNLETNFIDDVLRLELALWNEKGFQIQHMRLAMADNVIGCHLHEIQIGTYDQAHRHRPGAHVLILEGKGYELCWIEGQTKMKLDFKPGSIFAPLNAMYHQHFNSGKSKLKQIAFRSRSPKWSAGERELVTGDKMDLIRYEDEDAEVRKIFETELKKEGVRIANFQPTSETE